MDKWTKAQGGKVNINRRLLLHGAIWKDKGNGLQFYKVLETATVDDLKSALEALDGYYGTFLYSYSKERKKAIEKKLEGMGA
jgi:hypothetical protein